MIAGMKSPFTGKQMKKVYEKRTWKFRGEQYDYVHTAWQCVDTGELFTTDDTDDMGFAQVTNQYRVKYGIPFTDEIISVRKMYGVAAAKMSLILGIGINQWRHYESGEVPNISNGRMIRSIMNPETFLDYVHSSKHLLDENEYLKLIKKIESIVISSKENKWRDYAHSRIFTYERGSENGYGRQSLGHLKNVLLYVIENCQSTFCTKMNKILFYIDFVAYRKYGTSITGLTYRALDYGPVPERWDRIYSQFDEIVLVPRLIGDKEGIELQSTCKADREAFSHAELEVLDEVCGRFAATSAAELSRISHEEDAWLKCKDAHGLIPYEYAFELRGIGI